MHEGFAALKPLETLDSILKATNQTLSFIQYQLHRIRETLSYQSTIASTLLFDETEFRFRNDLK